MLIGNLGRSCYKKQETYQNKTTAICEVLSKYTLYLNNEKKQIDQCVDKVLVLYKARERDFCNKVRLKLGKRKRLSKEAEEQWLRYPEPNLKVYCALKYFLLTILIFN